MEDTKKKNKKRGCLRAFGIFVLVCFLIFIFTGAIGGFVILSSIPALEELTPSPIAETSKVFAIDGTLITEFHAGENREIIPFSQMSENIRNAIVAVEDKRYYDHQGVDYKRIIGAFIADVRSGSIVQGASTITMQYLKNVYFTPEKTLRRKINEAVLAIQLERNYTKDKILEMYLNTIYFGAGAYGVEKAAQTYFGVSASELSVPQSALLAAIIRAPEIYNPFNSIEKAEGRRNMVLKMMYEQGFIDTDEYLASLESPVILNGDQSPDGNGSQNRIAPYFIDHVKQQLYEKKFTDYDVFKGGLRIYTTLDPGLQEKAEQAIKTVFPEDPGPSYALISIDPSNGYIYALVGGKDYNKNKFNIATQGKRQPGSVFKTTVLMESIKQHMSPNDTYNPNGPIVLEMPSGPDWKVENYGGKNYETDKMTVIDGTIFSVNVVYAQLMMKVGAENVERLCEDMFIYDIGNNPAIALGGLEVGITPLDVSKIFSTLANNGRYNDPVCITRITDSEGNELFSYDPQENENNHSIMEDAEAYLVTEILERVISEGTGKGASIGRPSAGKTGTTSDYRDAWFAGYTPELSTVVWMGHLESTQPMEKINDRNVVGGSFPADIWREYMSSALDGRPVTDFDTPENALIDIQVCTESGKLPTFWCPEEALGFMIFVKGKEPTDICDIHNKVAIPDVIGQNIEEVRQMLADMHFSLNETFEFNDTFNDNIIFDSDPAAGTVVESPDGEPISITLFISKGLQTYDMPDLIGLTKEKATNLVRSLGLASPEVIYEFSIEQPVDRIFAQDPPALAKINKTTSVTIFISKGENPEGTIPGVIGMTEEDAIEALGYASFKNVLVILEDSEEEIDLVFAQIPESGTVYEKTLEVVIKISKGIEVPDVTGMDKMDASALLEDLGFVVIVLPDSTATGNVIDQFPEAYSYLNYGSTVEIELKDDTGGTEPTEPTEPTDPPETP